MHKMSTTKITILFVSILSCIFLFSCADPNNSNSVTEAENKVPETTKQISHAAMIGSWVNPDDSSDTVTITETEVIYSVTALDKLLSRTSTGELWVVKIVDAETVNEQFLQKTKDARRKALDAIGVSKDLVRMDYNKNPNEYCTWNEKFDIEFSNLKFFQKTPSLFFGTEEYVYFWLNNETLNTRYMTNFLSDTHKDCVYIKKDSNTGSNTSSLTSSNLIGSYTISEANGSTFTFSSNDTWTYKYNSSTTNGTWSVSSGELTIRYSLGGYSCSAVFTVNVSGNKYTLTGKSGDYTTIIASAFKITNQTSLEKGVVTLVKQ